MSDRAEDEDEDEDEEEEEEIHDLFYRLPRKDRKTTIQAMTKLNVLNLTSLRRSTIPQPETNPFVSKRSVTVMLPINS
jgi:hypothetical protein